MRNAIVFLALLVALSACAASPAPPVENPQPPAENASSADEADYSIIAGDILQVTVWKEDGLDREELVLPDGSITFPLIGSIMVQGHSPSDVQEMLKKKIKKYIPNASVSVAIKAALGHTVSVIGQVAKPGEFVISHRMTAMQALSQAGGLTPYASERRIIVLRNSGDKEVALDLPYNTIAEGEGLDKDLVLQPGDVVVVPTASLF